MQQTFLFDMDGLLLDTERVFKLAFCEATQDAGCAAQGDAAFFDTLVGSSWSITEAALLEYLPKDVPVTEFVHLWERLAKARLSDGVPVKATVAHVLAELHARGAQMAVVTSSRTSNAREHLDHAGLLHYFQTVTGGDAVSANKPHPAPYLETAAALSVDAASCFAFEDSDRGITSAVRAGCTAVQIPDLRPPETPLPDLGQHVADDLHHAMRLIGVL